MKGMRKMFGVIWLVLVLLDIGIAPTMAQPSSTAAYSGDIWQRSTLTGDWGGARNDLACTRFDRTILTATSRGSASGGAGR
jgi:hypothetical protein